MARGWVSAFHLLLRFLDWSLGRQSWSICQCQQMNWPVFVALNHHWGTTEILLSNTVSWWVGELGCFPKMTPTQSDITQANTVHQRGSIMTDCGQEQLRLLDPANDGHPRVTTSDLSFGRNAPALPSEANRDGFTLIASHEPYVLLICRRQPFLGRSVEYSLTNVN